MKKFFSLFFTFLYISQLMSSDLVWTSPESISTSMVDPADPQILMDLSGNTTAVWVENGSIVASVLPLNGSWSSPVGISGPSSLSPRLGLDSSGNVTALWVESGVIMAATLPIGGSWLAPTAISSSGASSPSIAVRSNGDIVAVWVRSTYIESATQLSGGQWGIVSMISGAGANNPDVAVGANGTVVAVWHSSLVADVIQSSSKLINGAWTTPKQLIQLSSAFSHDFPSVSVDSNGNADVVWYRFQKFGSDFINVVVFASSLPLNAAGWSPLPTYLSKLGICNPAEVKARIVHDPVGNALAFWSISYDNSSFSLESSLKLLGGIWTETFELLSNDIYAFEGDISSTSLNNVIVAYMAFDGTSLLIRSSEVNISGVVNSVLWTPPVEISTGSSNGFPRIASAFVDGEVRAAAVWLASNGGALSLQSSIGSRGVVEPPTALSVSQDVQDFGVYTDYYNTVSWEPSSEPDVVGYVVYRNGVLFKFVDSSTLEIVEHNVVQDGPVVYGVAAVDSDITQSATIYINFP